MTALKWIVTEAKKLKKQHPKRFATWREYVAQASAIYASKHKGKIPVGKKHKKSVGAVKKVARKKVASKKVASKSYHKDTKSHNVNIRVISGPSLLPNNIKNVRDHTEKELNYHLRKFNELKLMKKNDIKDWRKYPHLEATLKAYPAFIKKTKANLNEYNKLVKLYLK